MALGIVRYVGRWMQPLAVAFGAALGLFASTKVPATVMNAVNTSVCTGALNVKNPAPREKDRVWMAFTASTYRG